VAGGQRQHYGRHHRHALLRFNLEALAATEGLMQADGIHPAPQAQERMLDALWPALNAELLQLEQGVPLGP